MDGQDFFFWNTITLLKEFQSKILNPINYEHRQRKM